MKVFAGPASGGTQGPTVSRVKRVVMVLVVVAAVVSLLAAYVVLGSRRMETACSADGPGDPAWRSVTYGWSWNPSGFECTYDTGQRRTSLWF